MNTEDNAKHIDDGTEQPANATPMSTEQLVDEVAEYGQPMTGPSYEAAPVMPDRDGTVETTRHANMGRILLAMGLTVGALSAANLAGLGKDKADSENLGISAVVNSSGSTDINPKIMRAGAGCDGVIEWGVNNASSLLLVYLVVSLLSVLSKIVGGGKNLLWILGFPIYGPYKLVEWIVRLSREAGAVGPGQPAQLRSAPEILADFNLNGGTAMERLNVDANPGGNFRQRFTQLFSQMRQAFGNFRFANPEQGAELFERLTKWLYIELRLEDIKANGGAVGPAAPQAVGGPAGMRAPRAIARPGAAPAPRRMTPEEEAQTLLASKRELLENMIDDDLPLTEIPRTAIENGSLERVLASAAALLRSKGFTTAQITEIHNAVRRYLTVAPTYRPGNSFRNRRSAEMKRTATGPVAARAGVVVARFEGDALTYPAGRPNAGGPLPETIDFGSAEIANDIRQRATNLPALRRRGPLRAPYHGLNSMFPRKSKMRAGLLITLALAALGGAGYGGYSLVKWLAAPSASGTEATGEDDGPAATQPAQPAREKAGAVDNAAADSAAAANTAAVEASKEALKDFYLRAKTELKAMPNDDPDRKVQEESVKRLEQQLRDNGIDPAGVKPKAQEDDTNLDGQQPTTTPPDEDAKPKDVDATSTAMPAKESPAEEREPRLDEPVKGAESLPE